MKILRHSYFRFIPGICYQVPGITYFSLVAGGGGGGVASAGLGMRPNLDGWVGLGWGGLGCNY